MKATPMPGMRSLSARTFVGGVRRLPAPDRLRLLGQLADRAGTDAVRAHGHDQQRRPERARHRHPGRRPPDHRQPRLDRPRHGVGPAPESRRLHRAEPDRACWSPDGRAPAATWSRRGRAACTITCVPSTPPCTCASRFASDARSAGAGGSVATPCTFGRDGPAFTRISRDRRSHENCKTSHRIPAAGLRRNSRRRANLPALIMVSSSWSDICTAANRAALHRLRSSPWAHWPRCHRDGWPPHRNRRDRRPRRPPLARRIRSSRPRRISRPSVPLRFEPLPAADNGTRVFVARSAGYAVHVGPTWAEVHATARPGATAAAGADPIAMRFVGAAAGPREVSLEGAATTVNYLVGADRDRWTLGLEARARVRFRDVYPGIDVAYYGTDREVEYDVLRRAGRRPGAGAAPVRPAPAASRSAPTATSSSGRPRRRCASARRSPTSSKARPASPCPAATCCTPTAPSASRSAATIAARRSSSIRS